jgi:sigma-B regulation protein RsbU (phosphoserine phosphatase)
MVLDENLQICYINQAMEETFGSITGRPVSLLFTNGDNAEYSDLKQISALDAILKEGRFEIIKTTLADVIYELRCAPATYKEHEKYLVIIFKDISMREHLLYNLEDNLKSFKKDTSIASRIQKSILPINDEYWNSLRLSSIYLPAEDIGGDIYDILRLQDGRILIYISDISGHGIQASLLTIFIRENVRLLSEYAKLGLDELARKLLETFVVLGISAEIYASILLCLYDPQKKELGVVNAGHNCFPLIQRSSGRVEEIPVKGMPISRISDGSKYEEEIVGIYSGDKVILYTDGIVEEFSMVEEGTFSPEGVRRVVSEYSKLDGEELAKKILDESAKYLKLKASDDRTIVIAEIL